MRSLHVWQQDFNVTVYEPRYVEWGISFSRKNMIVNIAKKIEKNILPSLDFRNGATDSSTNFKHSPFYNDLYKPYGHIHKPGGHIFGIFLALPFMDTFTK